MTNKRQPDAVQPRSWVVAVVASFFIAGCNSKPSTYPISATPKTASTTMSAAVRADAAKLAAQHPTYKLFLQKTGMPVILVVDEKTSDAELKSLLWHLRTEVQSKHFQQLGMEPTATSLGTPVYTSGVINIYRGVKCAREMYITSGPDPCGASIHKAASYHWGDGGDFTADSADIVTANGVDDIVFNADDRWQTEEAAHNDPDGKQRAAAHARITYAIKQNAKQSKSSSDIRFAVDDPDTQLRISSYQLANEAGQKQFLNQFLAQEDDHLCSAGFISLQLSYLGKAAKSYSIQCAGGHKAQTQGNGFSRAEQDFNTTGI